SDPNAYPLVGQFDVVDSLGDYFWTLAIGGKIDKVPLLIGPAGTGKSVILDRLSAVAKHVTNVDPSQFLYTFSWVNLSEIEALSEFLEHRISQQVTKTPEGPEVDDKVSLVANPIDAPFGQSPFVLLPKNIQEFLLQSVRERIAGAYKFEPRPKREMDPQTKFILDTVIEHYKNQGWKINYSNLVKILNKHVRIRRRVLDGSSAWPILDPIKKDVRWNQLIAEVNGFLAAKLGPAHILSQHLTGRLLMGDGGMILFDEVLRNNPDLLDVILRLLQSGILQHGASPPIALDTVILLATNPESLADMQANAQVGALLDRLIRIDMPLTIYPSEVEKLLLLKQAPILEARRLALQSENLEAAETQWQRANLDEIFPIPNGTERPMGPSRRFALRFQIGAGNPPVEISPHALELLAYVFAATRLHTDADAVTKLKQSFEVTGTTLYSDIISRLRLLAGQYPSATVAQRQELGSISELSGEGQFGISNRTGIDSLMQALIASARKSENGNTITLSLVMKVFNELLERKEVLWQNHDERMKYRDMITQVAVGITKRAVADDIMFAMTGDTEAVDSIYTEVIYELYAESNGKAQYDVPGSKQSRAIDKIRLEKIKAIYLKRESRPLYANEISGYLLTQMTPPRVAIQKYQPLVDAIAEYLTAAKKAEFPAARILEFLRRSGDSADNATTREKMDLFINNMKRLGYNELAVIEAFEFITYLENNGK
ncbi:MAG: hypothetical protein HY072_06525, partial [Deltaproteobacteria bacterium]|nr:hypothetical protein [Deltaproteobacteria bacterium]